MKLLFTICLLTAWLTAVAQVPTSTAPKVAPVKELTPAEIRQKERVAKVLEEERKYREEIAKAQREYQAKQAEKEQQRKEKEARKQGKEILPAPAVTSQPMVAAPEPVVAKPEKPAKTPRPEKSAKAPSVAPDSAVASPPTQPKRNRRESPPATTAPEPTQAERDAVRQQEETGRTLLRQQQQTERDARKAERAKARLEQESTAAVPALDPAETSVPGKEFLPKGHLFAPILLDPLEAQTYASILPAFRIDNSNYRGTIVPFAFGFCKPFFRWTKFPGRASELSLDVASFTQFEVYYDDAKQTQKRQLINTDYKFSVIYNLLRNNHVWRFRFYHLSSHLGDDYLFRNSIQYYTPNSVNYEIVDATYSQTVNNTRFYGGVGIGLRKPEERKLLSAHAGFYYRSPQRTHLIRPVGGVDLKVWQQTDFRPGIKAAVGIEVGKPVNPLTFVLEGYSGFRPYSEYENQYVRWIGIGFYFNPI